MRSTTALAPSPPSPHDCNWREAGFGIYIHWPFCQAKCPYCDFNSHVVSSVDHSSWRDALIREIERAARLTPGREVASVFFGGGTPSLMEPETVAAVLKCIDRLWSLPDGAEITLEANPTSVDAERFHGYRTAGVNRLSLGVQALNDGDLRRLGRLHSAAEARDALTVARKAFSRVSADLIYARQHQTLEAWQDELDEVLAVGLEHLSLYQLTIEDGTVFGERRRRGMLEGLPEEDLGADLYEVTQHLCRDAALPAYEVSNHARAGAESVHNRIYWTSGDWIGIGPGAKGRICDGTTRMQGSAPSEPGAWLRAAGSMEGATCWEPTDGHGLEYLMMGLRLVEGISLDRASRLGVVFQQERLDDLFGAGLLESVCGRLRLTERGRPLLNPVLSALA